MEKKIYTKEETQNNIYEHSQAKLDFYNNYLWRYLTILLNDPYTKKINIYDIFCGIGIYEDGGKGSPIIAADTINNLSIKYPNESITLTVNDINTEKVQKVKCYINNKFNNTCKFIAYNKDAKNMFNIVINNIKQSKKNEKNLIFIDPYGYKEIYRKNILDIMKAGKSEIILFLPISNMYRFSRDAIEKEENKSYMHLRRFIEEFFEKNHPIKEGKFEHQLEYIDFIREALCFSDTYYSTSYSIQRDSKNYYALFFITDHIYGFEKILETKWKLDQFCGEGFEKAKEPTLFDDINQNEKISNCQDKLKKCLKSFLIEKYRSNNDIYEYTLKCGFSPKHANEILENIKDKLIFDRETKLRKKSFFLGYNYYKKNDIKYKVKIRT